MRQQSFWLVDLVHGFGPWYPIGPKCSHRLPVSRFSHTFSNNLLGRNKPIAYCLLVMAAIRFERHLEIAASASTSVILSRKNCSAPAVLFAWPSRVSEAKQS